MLTHLNVHELRETGHHVAFLYLLHGVRLGTDVTVLLRLLREALVLQRALLSRFAFCILTDHRGSTAFRRTGRGGVRFATRESCRTGKTQVRLGANGWTCCMDFPPVCCSGHAVTVLLWSPHCLHVHLTRSFVLGISAWYLCTQQQRCRAPDWSVGRRTARPKALVLVAWPRERTA